MTYYKVVCGTPFVGEENDFTDEEYYAECHVISIEENTEEEYYEACPWEE